MHFLFLCSERVCLHDVDGSQALVKLAQRRPSRSIFRRDYLLVIKHLQEDTHCMKNLKYKIENMCQRVLVRGGGGGRCETRLDFQYNLYTTCG